MGDNITRYDDMDSARLTIDEEELDQFVRMEKSETCFVAYLINEKLILRNVSKIESFYSVIDIFSSRIIFYCSMHRGSSSWTKVELEDQ